MNRKLLLPFLALCGLSFGQASLTVTSLSSAVGVTNGTGPSNGPYLNVFLASCTGVSNPTLPIAGGPAIGDPSAAPYTFLVVDKEVMKVNTVVATSPCQVLVERGFTGSLQTPHVSGQMVYVTPPNYLLNQDPAGACTAANTRVQPAISYTTASVWQCSAAGQWTHVYDLANQTGNPTGYSATETGANNAIACAKGCGPALVKGLVITLQLAHSLQAGANTFSYNGTAATPSIVSHFNTSNNIGTAYASTGIITMIWNGTAWLDLSE